eukprot:COSAG03_NODE_553_length_6971_cov_3.971624_10_plen_76_part_00
MLRVAQTGGMCEQTCYSRDTRGHSTRPRNERGRVRGASLAASVPRLEIPRNLGAGAGLPRDTLFHTRTFQICMRE